MYKDSVFLMGNLEAQRLATNMRYSDKYLFVRKHFIYTCLLSENVFFPAANYFQSPITEKLSEEFPLLFRDTEQYPQLTHVAINSSKENFRGEALEKSESYVDAADYQCYKDPEIRNRLIKKLNDITNPYMRSGKLINSLNDYVLNETKEGGHLNKAVSNYTNSQIETQKILAPLVIAVKRNEKAIIPEYIMQFDQDHVINSQSEKLIRLSLLKSYSESLEKMYKSYVCNPLARLYDNGYFFPYTISYLDTTIFDMFLRMFEDIYDSVNSLDAKGIQNLKYSQRFEVFLRGYKKFVAELSDKTTSMYDIRQQVVSEKLRQDNLYVNKLSDIISNTKIAELMYNSMFGIKAKIRRILGIKVLKSDILFADNEDVFLYALVNEIYESFMNKYSDYLVGAVKSAHQNNRKTGGVKIIMNKKIFKNKGGTQINIDHSNGVNINFKPAYKTEEFNLEEIEQIHQLADAMGQYTGNEIKASEKFKLSGILFSILENRTDISLCNEKMEELKGFFRTFSSTAQKAVTTIATNILSEMLLEKLGLK